MNGLPKRIFIDGHFSIVEVNIFDIKTHKIVFSGSIKLAARFVDVAPADLRKYISRKNKIKKRYAARYKPCL